jgi:uncharacterized ferritin-like protein (DUF455 family)
LVRLNAPPVMGAVILGMEAGGLHMTPAIRARLLETTRQARETVARQS